MGLYKIPDSEIWWAGISHQGARLRVSTGEYDRKAAQKFYDKRKAELHDQPIIKGTKWSDVVMKWVNHEIRSNSDILSLANFGRHYKDRPLSSVTPESIDEALRKFCKTDGTYNRYATIIAAALTLSKTSIKIQTSPE